MNRFLSPSSLLSADAPTVTTGLCMKDFLHSLSRLTIQLTWRVQEGAEWKGYRVKRKQPLGVEGRECFTSSPSLRSSFTAV